MAKRLTKIVVIPGWTKSGEKMFPLVNGLKDRGYLVRLLAVPGLTGERLNKPWNLDDYQRWLEGELAGEREVVLMGHSNGGRIILKYLSETGGEKVAKTVLIGAAGIIDNKWWKVGKRRIGWYLAKLGGNLKKSVWGRRVFYKILRERDYYEADEVMRITMANLLRDDLRERLGQIKTETLLIWGQQDKMSPLYLGREMERRLSRAKLKVIKGAKHSPQATHLEEVIGEIEKFLHGEI
jgi:pimeloyl-ACP methyl ester carboxylesterase